MKFSYCRRSMRPITGIVGVLLFGSGLCALMFQLIWNRELSLVFGGASTATAAVTAVFMGGLGLGNWWWGERTDRSSNPLHMYGLLETAIALSAAVSPWLIDLATVIYISLGGQERMGEFGATLVRLLLTVFAVGLPTFLMGGTLPAAVKSVEFADDERRLSTAFLYGANTLGAVTGAVLGTFFALPNFGVRSVLWSVSLLNLIVATIAIVLARSPFERHATAKAKAPIQDEKPAPATFLYGAAATTGFAFFLLELVWFRLLGPILGGTVFTFGLILAAALLGIGLGGLFHSLFFRRVTPSFAILAATCLLEAACVAFPFFLGDALAVHAGRLQAESQTFGQSVLGWSQIALVVVFPASFVSGVQFPLLISLLGRGRRELGSQLGRAFAWNTLGAIVGSLAGGFGLLPLLTAPVTWTAVAGLLVLLGAAGCWVSVKRGERAYLALSTAVAAGFLAAYFLSATGPTAYWRHSGIGAGRELPPRDPVQLQNAQNLYRRGLVEEADGVQAGIGLLKDNGLAFIVNGKGDGHAIRDAGTQIMLGLLGALLHPQPERCFVVGLGTGESAGWLAESPDVKEVVVAELEPAVDRMAALCAPVNHDVLRHPKVRRVYNDAREMLLTTSTDFDLIVSEPSNPYRPGVANLFTEEFYRACRARLRPQGLFVQWLQGYEIDDETIAIVLKTLRSTFLAVEIWQSMSGDLLLVCHLADPIHDADRLAARLGQEPFRSGIRCAWREDTPAGVWARFIANNKFVSELSGTVARTNTDDRNSISFSFARTLGKRDEGIIHRLRQRAVAANRHRPRVTGEPVDWAEVDSRWQVAQSLAGGEAWQPANADAIQRARAEMLRAYWQTDMAGVIRVYEQTLNETPLAPDEAAVLALAYADQTQPVPPRVRERLASFDPATAAAIQTYADLRAKRTDEAVRGYEAFCIELRSNPWIWSHAASLLLASSPDLAAANPAAARRIYLAQREPFCVAAFEDHRLGTLWQVATLAGEDALIDALAQYEPHVPWNRPFLEVRRKAYVATRHPLADTAARDLERFDQMTKSAR